MSSDSVMGTLYAAKKYLVTHLIEACIEYLTVRLWFRVWFRSGFGVGLDCGHPVVCLGVIFTSFLPFFCVQVHSEC